MYTGIQIVGFLVAAILSFRASLVDFERLCMAAFVILYYISFVIDFIIIFIFSQYVLEAVLGGNPEG